MTDASLISLNKRPQIGSTVWAVFFNQFYNRQNSYFIKAKVRDLVLKKVGEHCDARNIVKHSRSI